MKRDPAIAYHARMQRTLAYIDEHLDGDLSIETLAGVAAFSKCHFQRQFSFLFGLSVRRYVQLVRLKRASCRLAFHPTAPVLEIALDSGYEGPEAFTRAFRRCFDQSPSEFRKDPRWETWNAANAPLNHTRSSFMRPAFTDGDVRLVDFPGASVAIMEHRGPPAQIGDTIRRFIAWRRANGLPPKSSATFNLFHDDPDSAAPEDYRLDLCAGAAGPIAPNEDGVRMGEIPAGPCAVLRLTGPSDDLRAPIFWLYAEWLPRSGRELRDFPIFAQRVSFYPETPEHEAVTDIFLPLK
jgi:AraC family transcriptional regulator